MIGFTFWILWWIVFHVGEYLLMAAGLVRIGQSVPAVITWKRSRSHDALMQRIAALEIATGQDMTMAWSREWIDSRPINSTKVRESGFSWNGYKCWICNKKVNTELHFNSGTSNKRLCTSCESIANGRRY